MQTSIHSAFISFYLNYQLRVGGPDDGSHQVRGQGHTIISHSCLDSTAKASLVVSGFSLTERHLRTIDSRYTMDR